MRQREKERGRSSESLLVGEIGAIKAQNKKVHYTLKYDYTGKSFKGHFVQRHSREGATT